MSETVDKIIFDLLQYRRAAASATAVFAQWKHDADLCPKLQRTIKTVFSAIEKYQTITYDIQGPRDAGTDVVLRDRVGNDAYEYVCFQVKSHSDLTEKDYLKTLKSQVFDSRRLYQSALKDYYVLTCCSLVMEDKKTGEIIGDKAMKGKTRLISGELALEKNVHVIDPEFALAFFSLNLVQIDAVVKKRFSEGDVVLEEAKELVSDLTPTETALLIFVIWKRIYENKESVTIDEVKESEFIRQLYESIIDRNREAFFFFDEDIESDNERDYYEWLQRPTGLDFDTRIIYDLDFLAGERLQLLGTDAYSVELKDVQALVVIMMDGNIRFEDEGAALLNYVMNVLRDDLYRCFSDGT